MRPSISTSTTSTAPDPSRRDLLTTAATAAAGLLLAAGPIAANAGGAAERLGPAAGPSARPAGPWRGLKVGLASYTFRNFLPDAVVKAMQRVELKYVSVKDFHLSLKSTPEERRAVAKKFQDAGITPLSCGVIAMQNDAAALRNAFEYARDLGVPTIVCDPYPDALPALDKLVKEFDIRLAIHNHGPEDKRYPSPYEAMKAAERFDERIGLCIDVGHTARAKVDSAEAVRKCAARVYDVHFKDVAHLDRRGPGVECGRGVMDLKSILQALLEVKFAGHLGFEHEKDPQDPLPGLAESVGYTKGLMAAMG
jgi:inosose dehydratase